MAPSPGRVLDWLAKTMPEIVAVSGTSAGAMNAAALAAGHAQGAAGGARARSKFWHSTAQWRRSGPDAARR